MNTKLFYNVDKNLSETFKNDPITKNTLGIDSSSTWKVNYIGELRD